MDITALAMTDLLSMMVDESIAHQERLIKAGTEVVVQHQENAVVEEALATAGVHVDMTV